jgi:hypothetical protein
VLEDLREAGCVLSDWLRCRVLKLDSGARLDKVDGAEADEESHGSNGFEVKNRFAADAAHGFDIAGPSYADDKRREDQRGDDRFDEAQKNGAEDRELFRWSRKRSAKNNAADQGDDDPGGKRDAFQNGLPAAKELREERGRRE